MEYLQGSEVVHLEVYYFFIAFGSSTTRNSRQWHCCDNFQKHRKSRYKFRFICMKNRHSSSNFPTVSGEGEEINRFITHNWFLSQKPLTNTTTPSQAVDFHDPSPGTLRWKFHQCSGVPPTMAIRCIYIHACIYIYTHIFMYMCKYVYVYMCMYIYIYTCMYICIYVYICIYMYIYVYICIYMYIYVYMYICIYVYMYICIYVYMYICIYVYMYTWHVQVVPGRAGGGSFRGKNDYKPKTEFAYRMCARRPTSAIPKRIFLSAPAVRNDILIQGLNVPHVNWVQTNSRLKPGKHPLCWKFLQFFSRKVLGQKRARGHFFTTKYLNSKALRMCWKFMTAQLWLRSHSRPLDFAGKTVGKEKTQFLRQWTGRVQGCWSSVMNAKNRICKYMYIIYICKSDMTGDDYIASMYTYLLILHIFSCPYLGKFNNQLWVWF